jgi:hypothetical protein
VEDIYGFRLVYRVKDPEGSAIVAEANLIYPWADDRHGFEVGRKFPVLYGVEIMPGFLSD